MFAVPQRENDFFRHIGKLCENPVIDVNPQLARALIELIRRPTEAQRRKCITSLARAAKVPPVIDSEVVGMLVEVATGTQDVNARLVSTTLLKFVKRYDETWGQALGGLVQFVEVLDMNHDAARTRRALAELGTTLAPLVPKVVPGVTREKAQALLNLAQGNALVESCGKLLPPAIADKLQEPAGRMLMSLLQAGACIAREDWQHAFEPMTEALDVVAGKMLTAFGREGDDDLKEACSILMVSLFDTMFPRFLEGMPHRLDALPHHQRRAVTAMCELLSPDFHGAGDTNVLRTVTSLLQKAQISTSLPSATHGPGHGSHGGGGYGGGYGGGGGGGDGGGYGGGGYGGAHHLNEDNGDAPVVARSVLSVGTLEWLSSALKLPMPLVNGLTALAFRQLVPTMPVVTVLTDAVLTSSPTVVLRDGAKIQLSKLPPRHLHVLSEAVTDTLMIVGGVNSADVKGAMQRLLSISHRPTSQSRLHAARSFEEHEACVVSAVEVSLIRATLHDGEVDCTLKSEWQDAVNAFCHHATNAGFMDSLGVATTWEEAQSLVDEAIQNIQVRSMLFQQDHRSVWPLLALAAVKCRTEGVGLLLRTLAKLQRISSGETGVSTISRFNTGSASAAARSSVTHLVSVDGDNQLSVSNVQVLASMRCLIDLCTTVPCCTPTSSVNVGQVASRIARVLSVNVVPVEHLLACCCPGMPSNEVIQGLLTVVGLADPEIESVRSVVGVCVCACVWTWLLCIATLRLRCGYRLLPDESDSRTRMLRCSACLPLCPVTF